MPEFVDHYRVLQVDPEADVEVIQAAYRALARKYHPDVATTREAAERMTAINGAWQVLRSAERREAWDKVRAQRLGIPVPTPTDKADPAATTADPAKPSWPEGRPGFRRDDLKSPRGTNRGNAGGPPGKPSGTVLDFGRYKGWSLGQISKQDPEFLEWFVRMPIARPYVREINELLAEVGRKNAAAQPPPTEAAKKGRFRR